MPFEYATVNGSGTVPSDYGPVHGITQDQFPMPDQRNDLRTRRAEGVALLNPEDLSVNVGLRSSAVTVTTSATPLPTNPFEYRRALVIHNNGASTIYIGGSNVTTSTGLPLDSGEKIAFDIMGLVTVYAIAGSSTDVRILELA